MTESAQYAQETLKVLKKEHTDDGEAGIFDDDDETGEQ